MISRICFNTFKNSNFEMIIELCQVQKEKYFVRLSDFKVMFVKGSAREKRKKIQAIESCNIRLRS